MFRTKSCIVLPLQPIYRLNVKSPFSVLRLIIKDMMLVLQNLHYGLTVYYGLMKFVADFLKTHSTKYIST